MATMQLFKKVVHLLKDVNLSVAAKLQKYSCIRDILSNKLMKEDAVKNEGTLRCLFDCIKSDVSESSDLRQSALATLDQLCKSTWRNFIIHDLTDIYIYMIFDDVTKDKDDVRATAIKRLQYVVKQQVLHNDCDPEKLLLKVSKDAARKNILELLEKACKDIPTQQSLLFFYETIVPALFNTSHADIRGCLVEFVLASLTKFDISSLSPDKLEKFKISTKKCYVEKTVNLLESGDPHWNNVWIFLVRSHGKRLHTHSDLMNSLLKVVEVAFRSKVIYNNSAAYDCWKELIDVYSLDLAQMCSPKYMKLLLLPLKNNALKNGNLTKKRFEIWTHLISILQEKSNELCIRPFLEFCFGPLGDNPLITRGNPNIGSPARNDPELWTASAQALLEIMGHCRHDASNSCMCYTNYPLLKLEKPLITPKTFMAMDYIIINSVGECCSLMINRMNTESTKNSFMKIITCLWDSLFSIIEQLEKSDQESAIRRVTALLVVCVELSNETPAYFEYILKPVFELLSNKKLFHIDVLLFNTQLLFPLLKKFLKHNDVVFLSERNTILELLQCSKNTHNKDSWLEEAFEIFLKSDVKKGNIKGLLSFWVDCADVLNDICEFPTAQTEKVVQGVGIRFMVWPVLNMYRLPLDQTIIITKVSQRWGNTFASMLKTYTKESLTILIDIQKNIDTSPFIASHVVQLFPGFQSLLEMEPNHKFVMILLNQTSILLGIPTVTKEVKSLLLPTVLLIMNYFTQQTETTLKYSDFQHVCQCLEHLLQLHKEFSILEPMDNFFDEIPKTFQENVPQSLCAVVEALKTHSDDNISRKAQKLSSKLIIHPVESSPKAKETFLQPKCMHSTRAAKITNMAIATPKSPKADNPSGTTVLHLLGHKVETPSPVRVRGSLINSNGKPQKRKAANVFPEVMKSKIRVDDEEASYVLIDQHYQFDPSKLSEHQMEVMKKRRPDIPALYQDLSQSQSNSQNVNFAKIADNQNEAEEKSGSKSPNSHNETLVKNATKPEVTDNTAISEDLFQTEDVTTASVLPTSNSSEKKENCIDNGDTKLTKNESISVQNISVNSEAQSNECKTDEKEVNVKFLKILLPRIEGAVVFGTEESKEETSQLNQQTHKATRGKRRILKPKILCTVNSNGMVEASDKSDIAISLNKSHLKRKIDDPVCGNDKSVIKSSKESDNSCSARIDLKIKNPSMKIIEAMIAEDSPSSNYNQGFLSVILKQPTSSDDALQQEKPLPNNVENRQTLGGVDEDHKNQDSLSNEEKKRQKIRKELNKIKMDIVGGDAFVRNLDLTERVKTRRSVDVAALTLRSASKMNYDSDDSKSSSSSDSSRKSKLRAIVKIVEKGSKDKLPLSPKSSGKLRQSATPHSPVKSNNDTSKDTKLSPVRRKIVPEDTNIESDKNNALSDKQVRKTRSSMTLEEPSLSTEGNTTRKSKSVTPEKPSELVEENVSPSRRSSRSDKNWIANVNKSLAECAKYGKVGARKSLANILESASKADTSGKQNVSPLITNSPAKTNQMKQKLSEAESKVAKGTEFTVTLVGNAESQDSEDVIESSQESCIEIKPCQNLDNSFESIKEGINLQIEEVVTQLRKGDVQNSDDVSFVIEKRTHDLGLAASTSDFETNEAKCNTQDVENIISMDNLSTFSPDELMRMDLASHIKPAQNDTCEMDTETLELLSNTPVKCVSIPTSPIASDTPIRTSELITNTLNISPIKVVPKSMSTNRESNSEKTPDLFDSEPCTSNKDSTPKLEGPSENNIKCCDSVQNMPYQQLATPSCSTISDKANQRSLKLLRMLPHAPSPENYNVQKVKQIPKSFISSPKTHRIIKMMKTFEKKPAPEAVEEVVKLDLDEEPKKVIQEKDILKFVKELPSPMASPRYGILKRRAPDSRDEGLSPPRKKRVNFSDPPTTCEKVFFKDKHEHSYGKKDDYNEDTGYGNNTNTHEMRDIPTSSTNAEPPILEPMEYVEPPILEAVKAIPTIISNNSPNGQPLNKDTCSETETESLSMKTQGSVDTTVPCLLESNEPILPEFVHCKESIDCIVGKMTNPLFSFALVDELHKKRVFTIGDLAKLAEIEVARLPFRTPKVLVVRSTLRKFMTQKNAEGDGIESTTNNEDVEDKSTTINDKEAEEKSKGIINDEEQKRNSILTKEKQNSLADNSPESKVLSATSDSPKVKIVSSVILQPARTVPQNSTKIDKTPRRIPLIKVTTPSSPSCSTFMQVEPAPKLDPSSPKESDNPKTVIFGNVEEREKLRIRIPELIADFQEMREKVKRQGLSTTSLYELIIEIVGTEEFVSILLGNGALSINHFVKNDGWCTLTDQILSAIGLNKTVSCLCNACTITPLKLIDSIIDHITTEQEGTNCSSSLEKIAHRVLKTVPLANILKKFGMRRIVDALCDMNKCSEFTVEDFFQHATFRFSPNLDDMVPSFSNINIVHISDKVVQLSSHNKNDFEAFKKNIGAVVDTPTFSETTKAKEIVKCIPEIKKDEVMRMLFNELPSQEETVIALIDKMSTAKQEKLGYVLCDKMSPEKQKEIAFSMFDKMSDVDAYNYWTSYFGKRLWKT